MRSSKRERLEEAIIAGMIVADSADFSANGRPKMFHVGRKYPFHVCTPFNLITSRRVTRLSSRGYPFTTWERTMPRVVDRVTDCAVYLYESEADAHAGERTGGSGFLFAVPMDLGRDCVYAVSNWHVVRHAPVVRLNKADGQIDVMPRTTANWYQHQDKETDLAVAPLDFELPNKYRAAIVGYDQLLTREWGSPIQRRHRRRSIFSGSFYRS